MKLNKQEFKGMNTPFRWWCQKNIEFEIFKQHLKKCNINLKNTVILDVGCGSGLSTSLISQEFTPSRLVAFDFMPEQVELAKNKNIQADFFVGDAANINLPSSAFDAVFVMGVLHHIPEWKKALQEIYRVLKKDGVFLIEEPSNFLILIANIILRYTHPKEAETFWNEFEKESKNIGFDILSRKTILCLGKSFLLKKVKNV